MFTQLEQKKRLYAEINPGRHATYESTMLFVELRSTLRVGKVCVPKAWADKEVLGRL